MAHTNESLDSYYELVQKNGRLRSQDHAHRWSTAVLKTLGFNLTGSTKKALAKALPQPMAADLTRVFWLLHFHNPNLTAQDFLTQASRRSGNTDIAFARYPTQAVFGGLKSMIDSQLSQRVSESLSAELREIWDRA
ncbi:MAG: DUF2267 domain-containing protein [Ardenticatenaceae bacterium]|nr:DUF2267 domain-containing protein [Ardenticatenaceae bacterium]